MPKPPHLLILDCDGVLVDSEPIAMRVETQLLATLGWSLSESEIIERFLGQSQESIIADIERHTGIQRSQWISERDRLQREAFERELRPIDGVIEALDRIQLPMCVASNGSHVMIERSLRLCEMYERFAGRIFSASDVALGKPAPDLFLHAARRMDVEPRDAVVVEDSPLGIQAARAAGIRSLGFAGGLVPAERLDGATRIFTWMHELPGVLAKV